MTNDRWQMTKKRLFGRAWLLLGSLTMGLVLSACGTALAVEKPYPVTVTKADNPTTVPLTESTGPAVTDTLRPTPDASPILPTPIPDAQMAPAFSLPDLDGQTWTLSQFRGQPVMLFMWATW